MYIDVSNSYFNLIFIYGYVFFLITTAKHAPPRLGHACQTSVYSNDLSEEAAKFSFINAIIFNFSLYIYKKIFN